MNETNVVNFDNFVNFERSDNFVKKQETIKKRIMKKEYNNPTMRVVVIKHRCHLMAGSGSRSVTSVTGTGNDFIFAGDGLDDGDDDV